MGARARYDGSARCGVRAGVRAGYGTGYGTGWVLGRGYTGYPPSCSGRGPKTSGAGPEGPAGPGVVGLGSSGVRVGGTVPSPPLRGPVGPPGPSLAGTSECRPWANKARFRPQFYKVSQNAEVSPEKCQKACHSPCFPKRVPKVTSWISRISVFASLLSQGINGPFLTLGRTLWSK